MESVHDKSLAYSQLLETQLLVASNWRLILVLSVSESVLMTAMKMATLRGSPWYTPVFGGKGGVVQFFAET